MPRKGPAVLCGPPVPPAALFSATISQIAGPHAMAIITLTTDFGPGSPYVAAMKGVILGIDPSVQLVDITHAIPPQDIRVAAVVLEDTVPWFPPGTLHVAVVDPGVGTERPLVWAELAGQQVLGPDNGLFSRLAARFPPQRIVRLTEPRYWLPDVSATFHGRDILAPVAARLSRGLDPAALGVPQTALSMLDWPEVRRHAEGLEGSVLYVDRFGNVISDITRSMLADWPEGASPWVGCRGAWVQGISRTYAQHPPGSLVAVVGSTGRLELAVVGGSAAARLGASVGERFEVRFSPPPAAAQ